MSSDTNEYGRFQLLLDPKADTAQLFIENVNRTGEHWLTLALPNNPYAPIGYLRLRPMKPNSPMFQVVDVRPATGPLLPASTDPGTRRLSPACVGSRGPEVVDVRRPPVTPPVSTPARRHQTPKDQIALIECLDPNYVPPPQPDDDDVPVCCKACGRIDGDITEWICPECAALTRGEQEVEGAL